MAHAACQLVEHSGEFDPGIDELQELFSLRIVRVVERGLGERAELQLHVAGTHAEAQRGIEGVHHVQIVGPGFRPVFPGVHGGVGTDEGRLPVGRRTLFIVALQRGAVIGALIAEQTAVIVEPWAARNQPVPIVVANFVAEMAKQGAIGFLQLDARLLAHVIVGFSDVQGDQPVGMAGYRELTIEIRAEKVECQAAIRVIVFAEQRQTEVQQLRHQPALGHFQARPALFVARHREVGNGAIELAGDAALGAAAKRDQPVAAGSGVQVAATAVALGFCADLPDLRIVAGDQAYHLTAFWLVTQR